MRAGASRLQRRHGPGATAEQQRRAKLLGLIGTDIAYILSGDFFWARAGLWLAGIGVLGGWISGTIGLLDLIIVPQIRRLITAWCHAILAVMLLSVATLNWLSRLGSPDALIMPWGLYMSLLGGLLIALASFLGGQLVYDHAVGVAPEKTAERVARNMKIQQYKES